MRGAAIFGFLLIIVGLMAVPLFKETISRFLLVAIFGGAALILVVFVVGGVALVGLRAME